MADVPGSESFPAETDVLAPLSYHREVVALLRRTEPEVWAWSTSQRAREEQIEAVRKAMLRETYRLEATAHPDIHAHCRVAMTALGMEAPVTLYQAGGSGMNAALCFIPGDVHIVLYGSALEKLSGQELIALLGHELAHYRLWSLDDGAYHAVSRLLDHVQAYGAVAPSHHETARLFALYTEVYADRGSAHAAGAAEPAISMLVKTMTGLANVDASSYLRQAQEIDLSAEVSRAASHPEMFLRVQALDKWWRREAGHDDWIERRLRGPLSLSSLDLSRQHELAELTRKFFVTLLRPAEFRSEAVLTQVRRYLPDWNPRGEALDWSVLTPERIDASVSDYFFALVFDLAMADRDLRDELLGAGVRGAQSMGALDGFRNALRRDLKMTKGAVDRLVARSGKVD